jgi:uncharacterized protein YneF (UPF0154 family)
MNDTVRRNLAQALAQRPNLTPEQIQSLFTSLTNTSMDDKICRNLASYPGLTLVQIQSLIACFTNISMGNTSMGNKVYRIFASRLTSRPDLTPEHIQSLLALLKNTTINVWVHIYLASALAKRPNLTPKQIQSLIACLINTSRIKYIMSHRFFSTALAKHPDLTPEHIQSLFVLLKNTTIWVRGYLASALANRTDLTLEQIQSLFACLTDTAIDIWDRRSLALALAQHSSFNAKQLRQLLIYCLQEEIICEEYPSLIFSILQTYYSISTIEQQKIKVFPGLNAFLTRFSTWYALAEHEALFLYDEATGIALLRLSTQTIEIPLHLHPNPFLILSYEAWGGDLHPMETEEIFEQQAENYSPLLK